MRKIYDCFMFYNELDVLEVRLKELYDHVDHIVMTEANTTFSGHSKEYIFLDNRERFKPFLDKIIHIKVEDMPGVVPGAPDGMACMYNENHQRNVQTRGLGGANDNDIILICDMDEILRGSVVDQLREDTQHSLWGFNMPYFYYKFNYMQVDPLIYQVNPSAATWGRAKTYPTFSIIRTHGMIWGNHPTEFDDGVNMKVQHSGWHFTYQGGTDFATNKLLTTGHDDYRGMANGLDVDALIAQGRSAPQLGWHKGEVVKLDNYFPKCIVEDKERWKDYILPDGNHTVAEKLQSAAPQYKYFSKGTYMEHFWPTVEGFFSQPECDFLQAVLDRSDSPAHFVEVGSWKGRSAAFMAVAIHNSGKNVKFDCVDTWEGSDEIAHHSDAAVQTGTLRDVFERNMKPVEGKYTAVQLSSVEAAKLYKDKSLDFVFLDASHDYENVVADILAWLPKIKEDGIIGGHDALHPPIVKACADTVGHVDLNPARDCWYKVVQKVKDNILIIPAGPDSLFQNWNNYDNHNFDLAVINWGTHQLSNLEQATYVEHIPGYKWKIVSEFAKRHDLSQYKHIWILDDDCLTTPENIAATFDFCKEHNLDLAQPGLTPDSSRSHPPTLMIPGAKLHYTNTVEIMAPIFSQRAWPECSEHFGKMPLGVGYGLEGYWSDILQSVSGTTKFGGKVAVIDAYPVKHTRTVTGPNDYARMGIDPGDDGRYFQSLGFGWSFNTLDVLY